MPCPRARPPRGRRAAGALGVGAEGAAPGHPVPLAPRGDARPHRDDGAGALHARDERERVRVETGPVVDVDEVEAGGLDADHDLAGAGRGVGDVGETQDFGAAEAVHSNGLHGNTSRAEPV